MLSFTEFVNNYFDCVIDICELSQEDEIILAAEYKKYLQEEKIK